MRYGPAALALLATVAATPSGGRAAAAEAEASGGFEVTLTPADAAPPPIGAMTIAKTFHGGLEGTSRGTMLAVRSPDGGAGYVAMERVTATIAGRRGSFVLQHAGTIEGGAQAVSVTVVPGSGTDALAGIRGAMTIRMEGERHRYAFRYTLPR